MKDLKSLDIKGLSESEQVNLKGGCGRKRPQNPPPAPPPPPLPPNGSGA